MNAPHLKEAAAPHRCALRVYYEDTDAGGIVYYANYLKYAERARTELLRAAGIEQNALRRSDGLLFAVRRVEIDYLRPAVLDDALEVETLVTGLGGARLDMAQAIVRGGEVIARLTVRIACLGEDGRPKRLTRDLLKRFGPYLGPDALVET